MVEHDTRKEGRRRVETALAPPKRPVPIRQVLEIDGAAWIVWFGFG